MTPQQLSDAEAWLMQYTLNAADLDARTVAATWAAYQAVEDWENPSETLLAAATAAGTMSVARQMHVGLMAEFLANTVEILTGRRPGVPSRLPDYSRNADPFDVYSRPVFEYRAALAADLAEAQAEVEAEARAEVISLTDALLARRDVAQALLEDTPEVVGYRRAIRPELSETGTCGLCIAAASRVYSVEDLLPIHSRCKCVVIPVVADADPGERFNLADMQAIYESLGGTSRQELSKTRIRFYDDAELGPVVAPAA